MRVVGYICVSTEDQAQEGISLEALQERIEACCVAHDLQLLAAEADKGISAKNLNMPGLQAALQQIAAHEIEALVVYTLDRLTRCTHRAHCCYSNRALLCTRKASKKSPTKEVYLP
ncbi:MAG: recombinase family protein [Euryarchaeota archaeon]|nr:recombinase family protein [Euryarchaeota archaeon]